MFRPKLIAAATTMAFACMLTSPPSLAQGVAKRVVLIGASYAEGWGTPAIPGLDIVNVGVGGEVTDDILDRFPSTVLATRPDIVLIWGHINDIFRAPNGDYDTAVERATRNIERMIVQAQAAGIQPIVATEVTLSEPQGITNWIMSLLGRLRGKVSYQDRVSGYVRQVNDRLRRYAERQGIVVLDLERALDDGRGRRRPEYTRDDGSHISDAGYAALTQFTTATLTGRF